MDDSSGGDAPPPQTPPGTLAARPTPPPARGHDRGRREGTQPTPVRASVEQPSREPPAPIETPLLPLTIGGEQWIVREAGRTSSGIGMDSPAALVLLLFCRADDPDRPEREVLAPARRLDDLADAELEQLFGRSRPFRAPGERQEVFPDTRKRGGRGM